MAFKNWGERRTLQKLIDNAAVRGAAYFHAQAALNEFCLNKYGAEPGDVDADEIIDSVFGGSGSNSGIPAERFDEIMSELTAQDGEG